MLNSSYLSIRLRAGIGTLITPVHPLLMSGCMGKHDDQHAKICTYKTSGVDLLMSISVLSGVCVCILWLYSVRDLSLVQVCFSPSVLLLCAL